MFNIAYFLLDLILIVAVQMNIIGKVTLSIIIYKRYIAEHLCMEMGNIFMCLPSVPDASMHNIKAKTWMCKRI